MLKGRVNTGRSQRLLIDARALDTIGLKVNSTHDYYAYLNTLHTIIQFVLRLYLCYRVDSAHLPLLLFTKRYVILSVSDHRLQI